MHVEAACLGFEQVVGKQIFTSPFLESGIQESHYICYILPALPNNDVPVTGSTSELRYLAAQFFFPVNSLRFRYKYQQANAV